MEFLRGSVRGEPLASLLALSPGAITAGRMTYQLRRRRLHARLFRPGLAVVVPEDDATLRRAFAQLDRVMDQWRADVKLAA